MDHLEETLELVISKGENLVLDSKGVKVEPGPVEAGVWLFSSLIRFFPLHLRFRLRFLTSFQSCCPL